MCGIAGLILKEEDIGGREKIERMTDALAHRGPDGQAVHFSGSVALGHARLSIVDLVLGNQPMFSHDGSLVIVFNGEIYGYKDMRKKLSEYPFKTNSDTEVIIALYEKYGEDFLGHLPGMFSFALWDKRKNKLICGRDRFGEKPFYYSWGRNGEFIFASEIKAILASGLVEPEIDRRELSFLLKHVYVQPGQSIYKNIFVLPPAHKLILSGGKAFVSRYWFMPKINQTITFSEATEEFKRLFERSVKNQFVADVPVGVFLSGGLDSSTIVAIARDFVKDLNTFSFEFKDKDANEAHYAREVARLYKSNHHELYEGEHEPLGELLLKMQEVYDEPSGDSANIPTFLISRLARKYVKVVLTGEGADELLGGYVAYRPFIYADKNIYSWGFSLVAGAAMNALKRASIKREALLYQIISGGYYKTKYPSLWEAHIRRTKAFSEEEIARLGLESIPETKIYKPSWPIMGTVDDVMRVDLENFLPGDVHVKSDRASMANGLELRAPFLDVDFATFCLSLPSKFKITAKSDKIMLREAFSDKWPESLKTRKKHGFVSPIKKWLENDASVKELRNDYLMDKSKKIYSILPFDIIQPMIANNDYRTWLLLQISLWLETRKVKIVL